jgi:EmrB/QacA subfamily drug resistance transporter
MESARSLRSFVLLITTLSSFMTPFMVSALNLAIPRISADLGADAVALNWVALVYLLAVAAFLVPLGRVADLYGRKRVFVIGISLYALGSALAAMTRSVQVLIACRALQGIGGAMISATAVAILTSVYPPEERGRVLGINAAAVYTGLSTGPVLGGFLTEQLGWRSIFAFNALVALIILPLTLTRLRREWAEAAGRSFDWIGAVLYSVSLIGLMYGVSSAYEVFYAQWLIVGGIVGLGLFAWIELRVAQQPLLDLGRFRGNWLFVFSNLTALIQYVATFAVTFLLSLYLQGVKEMKPQPAGFVLLGQPVMMALLSPLCGWLSDRVEPRVLASLGMLTTSGALVVLSTFDAGTSVWLVLGMLALIGLGFSFFSSPNSNAVMGAVTGRDYGVAASVLGTMRSVGQAFSMAVILLFFTVYVGQVEISPEAIQGAPEIGQGLISVMRVGFRLFAGLSGVGLLFSIARGKLRR